jgi:hypothetical protein
VVSQLLNGRWVELAVHGAGDLVRAEPFADIEIDLGQWWPAPSDAAATARRQTDKPPRAKRRRKKAQH